VCFKCKRHKTTHFVEALPNEKISSVKYKLLKQINPAAARELNSGSSNSHVSAGNTRGQQSQATAKSDGKDDKLPKRVSDLRLLVPKPASQPGNVNGGTGAPAGSALAQGSPLDDDVTIDHLGLSDGQILYLLYWIAIEGKKKKGRICSYPHWLGADRKCFQGQPEKVNGRKSISLRKNPWILKSQWRKDE
jgi:hypothetical protein